MKTFLVPTRGDVEVTNQTMFDNVKKALGFVANLYSVIGYSENGLARYQTYQNAKTTLTNKEMEAVNLLVSQVNGCLYRQSAHTVIGKMNGFNDDQLLDIQITKSYFNKPLSSMINERIIIEAKRELYLTDKP